MAAIDDLKTAIGAVTDDVKRIADNVQLVLDKLATSNDPAIVAATSLLKTVDADLDAAAEAMEGALKPPVPAPTSKA